LFQLVDKIFVDLETLYAFAADFFGNAQCFEIVQSGASSRYTNIKIPRYVCRVNDGFAAQILINLPGASFKVSIWLCLQFP
jgi:hypothetical protein